MQKRIVAFDIGDKRVGVAASDPNNTFALPGTTYIRTKDAERDAAALAAILKRAPSRQVRATAARSLRRGR